MKRISILVPLLMVSSLVSYAQWVGTNPVYFNTGNVGIGISTPQSKFHVMESLAGQTPNGPTINSGFMISGNSTGGSLNMGIDANNTYSTTFYSWIQSRHRDIPNYYNLALNPIGGNVGIGTASPITKLQIMDVSNGGGSTSTIPNQGLLISGNSTGGSLNMGIDATGSFYSWIQSRIEIIIQRIP